MMIRINPASGRNPCQNGFIKGIKIFAISFSALLIGCETVGISRSPQGLEVPSPQQEANESASFNYSPKPRLTPRERFRYALELLNQDQAEEALIELETYLLNKPRDSRAKRLVNQITLPTSELYPPDFFPVTLEWGQTLSSLSRDYLGDVYGFYGLAKYNGIPVSSSLRVGDVINIPATAKALAAREKKEIRVKNQPKQETITDTELIAEETDINTESEPVSSDPTVLADPEVPADTELALAEELTEPANVIEEPAPSNNMLLDAISGDPEDFIRKAMTQDSFVVAATTLDELKSSRDISPELAAEAPTIYERAANTLESEDAGQSARYYYLAGQAYLDKGDRDAALPVLKRSVELDSTNQAAASTYRKTQARLASSYHRLATNAYRKQKLDEAIALWEYVLEIDPDYSAAKTFLVQANELKAKLSKIREQ